MSDDGVQAALQLSEEQHLAIVEAARTYQAEATRYLSGAVDGDDGKLRDELLTLRKAAEKLIDHKLSASQREAWAKLLGPVVPGLDPIDFDMLRRLQDFDVRP